MSVMHQFKPIINKTDIINYETKNRDGGEIKYTIRNKDRLGYACINHSELPITHSTDIDSLLFDCFNKDCLGIVEKNDNTLYYCSETNYEINKKPVGDFSIDYMIQPRSLP